jgi:predicted amidophosphoribosyltransferase
MTNERKAEATNFGYKKTNELNNLFKAFFSFDNNKNNTNKQCIRCKSDYMRYSIDGYCQDCIQRVEYVNREHPQVLRKVREFSGGQV